LKKAQRNDAICGPKDKRHDDADTRQFLSLYEKLENVHHKLPVKHDVEDGDFLLNEREDFFFATLLALMKKKKLAIG